jgi:signal transduction histidine kinase
VPTGRQTRRAKPAALRARGPSSQTFLEEVALLATSARTWDELMRTVIERTTAAVDAEVCSVYLVDRDGSGVTLAATNGLDPRHVGVARLPIGVGITGRVAATGKPIVSVNVRRDRRFAWLAGVDEPRLTSMASVPLLWNDRVIGVLNVQTVERRAFTRDEIRFLEALAALLAGIVEKGRLQREAESQLAGLQAIDETRARLVTIVTHDLRTPLAIIRASVELLGEAASDKAASDQEPGRNQWEAEALRQIDRLDSIIDTTLAGLRVIQQEPPHLGPTDVADVVDTTAASLRALLRRQRLALEFDERPLTAVASPELLGRLLEYLLENASKYAPARGTIRISGRREGGVVRLEVTDDGPGIPPESHVLIFEPFVRRDDSSRGSGIGLFAARHLARTMGGDLRLEPTEPSGSRFVLELTAAHGPAPRGSGSRRSAPRGGRGRGR